VTKKKNPAPPSAARMKEIMGFVEKRVGKGSIRRMGDNTVVSLPAISSGLISVDMALGIGGYPTGRIVEIYGPESSGKTTLTLHAMAECQKQGGVAAFVDAEHALDIKYASNLGVDVPNLLVSQPDTGEHALEAVDALVDAGANIIVVDSVAALTPRAELEGEMGDTHVGLQARLMSQALRKLTGKISKHDCCVIFINQIRMKIGVTFGSPETTSGGNALKFYASQRLDIRRIGGIKPAGQKKEEGKRYTGGFLGNRTRVKVVKNKLAPPFREAEFDIMYGTGMSKSGDLVDLGVETGIIDKAGSWYSYGGERLGQGRENAKETLETSPDIMEAVDAAVRSVVFG